MNAHNNSGETESVLGRLLRSKLGFVFMATAAAGAAVLTYLHLHHIPREYILIAALLAICVGVHGFAHGGHGSHGTGKQDEQ